ncbi:MAG: hypothetical protein AB1295_00075 [Candidatus Micrarchaeota archaeon]
MKPTRPAAQKKPPKNIQDVFANLVKRAPEMAGLGQDFVDGRPLSAQEKWKLFDLLGANHDEETRCAAAFVIGKLGLTQEASEPIKAAFLTCKTDSNLRFMLLFAESCSIVMHDLGTAPPHGDQLEMLIEMRGSPFEGERRFAEIVLQKAGISWDGGRSW